VSHNSRLTVALHILSWMALAARSGTAIATSDRIALSVNTHPVVIRRALGLLRRAGLVRVQRGNVGGWSLARPIDSISVLDVYRAVEPATVFALHPSPPSQACPVGRGIQPALRRVYGGAAGALESELARTSVADVLAETLAAGPKAGVEKKKLDRG